MNRRQILQFTGATFTTGIGAGLVGNRQDYQANQEETEGESKKSACESNVQFRERELIIDESGFSSTVYAGIIVENVGDAASGEISVTAAWLDEAGNFVDEDSMRLPSLGAGETWHAYVHGLSVDPEGVDSFEISGDVKVGKPRIPNGMIVAESSFDNEENRITGVAENTREEDIGNLYAYGKIYDENGIVVGGSSDWVSDHPAGRNWSFEIVTPRLPGNIEPTDHDVILDSDTYLISG